MTDKPIDTGEQFELDFDADIGDHADALDFDIGENLGDSPGDPDDPVEHMTEEDFDGPSDEVEEIIDAVFIDLYHTHQDTPNG